jgi:hypothetical protein
MSRNTETLFSISRLLHKFRFTELSNYPHLRLILPSLETVLSLFQNSVVAAAFTTCDTLLFISFLVFSCYKDLSLAKKQDDVATVL